MSIAIRTCTHCGQVNPAFHGFCPVCGADLSEAKPRVAPWTFSAKFPPMAAAVDPDRRRRRRQPVPDARGAGVAWLGVVLVMVPIIASSRSALLSASWAAGVLAIMIGFWQMRQDAYTMSRAGIMTAAAAGVSLAFVGLKLVTTSVPELPATTLSAATATPTEVPDWLATTPAGPEIADVAMYRGDAAHTGRLPGPGITGRPYRAWRFDSAGELYSSPAVVDGVLYVGTKSGFLFALDAATGAEKWRADLGDFIIRSSPAIVDGVLYIGAGDTLFALDAATGEEKWRGRFPYSGSSSPTFVDGLVFVGSQSSAVYCFNTAIGSQKWSFQTDGPIFSSPAVADGLVFVGTDNGKVLALTVAAGQPKWRFEAESGIFSTPAVDDGVVYVTTKAGKTYALDAASGEPIWTYDAGGDASPAIAGGMVYVGGSDGGLYAIDAATGVPKWLFPTGTPIDSSPVVADGIVYLASGTTLYAIHGETGIEVWRYGAGFQIRTMPIVINGYVFIGGEAGYLDAVTGDGSQ